MPREPAAAGDEVGERLAAGGDEGVPRPAVDLARAEPAGPGETADLATGVPDGLGVGRAEHDPDGPAQAHVLAEHDAVPGLPRQGTGHAIGAHFHRQAVGPEQPGRLVPLGGVPLRADPAAERGRQQDDGRPAQQLVDAAIAVLCRAVRNRAGIDASWMNVAIEKIVAPPLCRWANSVV